MKVISVFIGFILTYKLPEERIFVGAQLEEKGNGYGWTACIPDDYVFVMHLTKAAEELDEEGIKNLALHELCHIRMHKELICNPERLENLFPVRRKEMENEANNCIMKILANE